MEGLSPQTLLLQESKNGQQFTLETANEQFCDWLHFDRMDKHLQEEKLCSHKRQVSSNNINKISSPNYRRYSPCSNWTRSLQNFDIKFEHFIDSSSYIEHYRRAKQLRIEEKLAKLMQRKESSLRCQNKESFSSKNVQNSEQDKGCSTRPGVVKKYSESVKPSLPGSGYFAGRKWVHPKDFARICSKNIGVKCGNLRTQQKKFDKQVQISSTNMFLQGTGKPLNLTCSKNWTAPRHRTACKSAPASRQSHYKQNHLWNTVQGRPLKSPAQNKSLTCADLSLLLEKHSISQAKSPVQPTAVCHKYEQMKRPKESVDSKNDRLEYEKIFRNVFDFYEQNSDSRSHVYINT